MATTTTSAGLDDVLALALRRAGLLVDGADAFVLSLGLSDLGDIDLPPITGPAVDQAVLRAVAPLYLAADLEKARLLPAVELLAGLAVTGGIPGDLGEAGPLLAAFFRSRHERFAPYERRAFFTRLFGDRDGARLPAESGSNDAFEELLLAVAEELAAAEPLEPEWARAAAGAPLRAACQALLSNLAPRSGGMAAFASRDLLASIREALEILEVRALQAALGVRSPWDVVRFAARQWLGEAPDIASHVTRGKAGLDLLAFLAEVAPRLADSSRRLLPSGHPAPASAVAWLEASLALSEPAGPAAARGR
jgi:hypothetical protein